MEQLLIADSGSTKTEWAVVGAKGSCHTVRTSGLNPYYQTDDEMQYILDTELLPALEDEKRPAQVHFYGAGCTPAKADGMAQVLCRVLHLGADAVHVDSDMLGAARALCGHDEGIACILGTGSNSCQYDGLRIVANVSPLGFILGDEGSGAVLGRRLVADVLKGQLPDGLCRRFLERFALTPAEVVERVYRRPFPNRFLASLSPFLAENIGEPCLRALVVESFCDFLRRNVAHYDCRRLPAHFTGSVAYHYRDLLAEAAERTGMRLGTVTQSPLRGLVAYHTDKPRN